MAGVYAWFFNNPTGNIVLASVVSSLLTVYLHDKEWIIWKYNRKDDSSTLLVKRVVNAVIIAIIILITVAFLAQFADNLLNNTKT